MQTISWLFWFSVKLRMWQMLFYCCSLIKNFSEPSQNVKYEYERTSFIWTEKQARCQWLMGGKKSGATLDVELSSSKQTSNDHISDEAHVCVSFSLFYSKKNLGNQSQQEVTKCHQWLIWRCWWSDWSGPAAVHLVSCQGTVGQTT